MSDERRYQSRKCVARSSRTGKPCALWAINGADVCHKHGGSAPQVKARAERRLAEQAAAEAVAMYGLPVEIDPAEALLAEVHRTAGHVAFLAKLIANLEEDDLKQYATAAGELGITFERPAVWVQMYLDERRHLAAVSRAALAANVEERRTRLAEAHADLIVRTIEAVLADPALGLDAARQRTARQVAARHLRLVHDAERTA